MLGHHRWNVPATSASTSPGVFVARTRSGLLLFATVRSIQAASVEQAATSAARRTAVDRRVIESSGRGSELDLENGGEIPVLRIVIAVESVDHRADFRVVAFVLG